MKPIKFIDLLKLTDAELGKLKLVFNSNWKYDPSGRPEYITSIFGNEKKELDLPEMYRQGDVELVKYSTRLHDPENKRFHNGELAFCFIPYDNKEWLLANAFKVTDDSKN